MSYVRLTTFQFSLPKSRVEIQACVDDLNRCANESPDFEHIHYFADFENQQFGAISHFKSKEAREQIGSAFADIVKNHVGNVLSGTPNTTLYESFP